MFVTIVEKREWSKKNSPISVVDWNEYKSSLVSKNTIQTKIKRNINQLETFYYSFNNKK